MQPCQVVPADGQTPLPSLCFVWCLCSGRLACASVTSKVIHVDESLLVVYNTLQKWGVPSNNPLTHELPSPHGICMQLRLKEEKVSLVYIMHAKNIYMKWLQWPGNQSTIKCLSHLHMHTSLPCTYCAFIFIHWDEHPMKYNPTVMMVKDHSAY